jgi:DNA-cytosine methyltransferase
MRYLSLFSGIGGFEVAIHRLYPEAECIGYSEIDKSAITVYENHYPDHINLGNIVEITEDDIYALISDEGCDLVVGGFPCKNLSSLASIQGGNSGLEGSQSGLFFHMMRVIQIINKILMKKGRSACHVVFENNASMSKDNIALITSHIQLEYPDIILTKLNADRFGVQTRNRLFWTDFPISNDIKCAQTWDDILEPYDDVKELCISRNYLRCMNKKISIKRGMSKHISVEEIIDKKNTIKNVYTCKFILTDNNEEENTFLYKSRWQMSFHSDTGTKDQIPYSYPVGKSRPITASFGNHNVLIDRRGALRNKPDTFIVRMFSMIEIERLFGYDDDYTCLLPKSKRREVLGNSVVVPVIEHIINCL